MANQKSHGWRRARLVVAVLVVGMVVLCYWALSESAHHRSESERAVAVRDDQKQSALPESPPESQSEPPAAPVNRKLLVRDLGSGEPVAGASFLLRFRGEHTQEATTDRSGTVNYSRDGLQQVEVMGEDWTVARSPRLGSAAQSGVVWIFRQLEVVGTVRAADESDEFNPQTVRFTAIVDDEDERTGAWDGPSLRARWGVARNLKVELRTVSKDGGFVLLLPRIRGVVLAASARGWRPAIARLNQFMDTDSATVDLVLARGFFVRGTLLDEKGAPMPDQKIRGFTIVRSTRTEVTQLGRLELRHPEGGVGGGADTVTGEGFAKFQHGGVTDKDGAFELSVGIVGGTTFIWAYIKGYEPVELEVGQLQSDRESIRLQAQVARSKPVLISAGGQPLRRFAVVVSDLEFGQEEAQPAVQTWTDSEGMFSTDWLIVGRRYSFGSLPGGPGKPDPEQILHGCIVWTGQSKIDMKTDLRTYSQLFPK